MSEERKLVTILFADVTGSTSLGDALDPEDVRALMARYYAHARRVIAEYEGTLEKFIGDAVMAIFGMPLAHGDDAERAIAAALALRAAVAGDSALGHIFQLRLGVNTGEVVATNDPSSGDFLVTGDAVNVAARLQQHAQPGEILAGERTHAAARFAFLFGEPRAITAKGKPLPLRVFPVGEPRATRLRERPTLVGRKPDLLQLELLKERVAEERLPHLITLVAPAGTGKTRVIEEFLSRLDPQLGFRAAVARCLPYGQHLAFFPLRGMLQQLVGEPIDRTALGTAFTAGGYNAGDAAHLADLVLATLGGDGEGARDREPTFAAWRLLLEACGRQAPLVLIFEDIHWASDTLLDLLDYLTQRCKDAPIFMIALSRPELLDRRPNWGGGRQNSALLALQPLTAAQTTDLLATALPDWTPEQRARIVERSGGNPFFALEIARGLAERGASANESLLPDTVHGAVLARLDLLAPVERETMQVAAVAGRAVRPTMLVALLSQHTRDAIEAALDQLVARDLLIQAESDRYAFRHVLIRDVAYGTLARSDRIRLHSALALWLEANTPEGAIEFTAYHYREAVVLSHLSAIPAELPFPSERAVRALVRAGEAASRGGAFAEVLRFFQDALTIAIPADRLTIDEQLGDLLPWSETAYDAYRAALEIWRAAPGGDPVIAARLTRKALTCIVRGYVSPAKRPPKEELIAEIAAALELVTTADVAYERQRLLIARCYLWCQYQTEPLGTIAAELPAILAYADQFLAQGDWQAASEALDVAAFASGMLGNMHDVMTFMRRRLAIPALSAMERYDALNTLTAFHVIIGEYAGAIQLAQETLARLRPEDSPIYIAGSIAMALFAAYTGGLWDTIDPFLPILRTTFEITRFDPTIAVNIADGYTALLQIALAREDRPLIDTTFAMLERLLVDPQGFGRKMVTLIREQDLPGILQELPNWPGMAVLEGIMALNEAGFVVPPDQIDRSGDPHFPIDLTERAQAVARALAADDDARLAAAIDDAEAHHLSVYAARMRLVLAERTGDRRQLDHARPILEAVCDRRSLRRLEEISLIFRAPGWWGEVFIEVILAGLI